MLNVCIRRVVRRTGAAQMFGQFSDETGNRMKNDSKRLWKKWKEKQAYEEIVVAM